MPTGWNGGEAAGGGAATATNAAAAAAAAAAQIPAWPGFGQGGAGFPGALGGGSRSMAAAAAAGGSHGWREFECLTPFKLSVALLLRNYCVHVRGFENEPDNDHLMTPRQRTKFCLLLLRLTQARNAFFL